MENKQNFFDDEILFYAFVILIVFVILTAFFLSVVKTFVEKRDFIKIEIQRSVGPEKIFWKRELKKLYIYHIPVIGKIIFKYMK